MSFSFRLMKVTTKFATGNTLHEVLISIFANYMKQCNRCTGDIEDG